MSVLADLFKARLDEKQIRYDYFEATSERNEAIKITFGGKNAEKLSLFFFFDKNGYSVNVKSFEIARVPEAKLMEAYVLLNELNAEYRWVKFFLSEENEVTVSGDAVLDQSSVGTECEEILFRYLNIIDECYPKIMKVIWA